MDTERPKIALSEEGSWKDEFRLSNFKLNHGNPEFFVLSQCGPVFLYPAWTVFWLLYHLAWVIYDISDPYGGTWFIYLTNWGFVLIVTMQCIDTAITIYVHVKRKDILKGDCQELSWYKKVLWVVFNTTNAIAMLITLAYWTLLTPQTNPESVNKHALNYVFVIANVCFSAKPIRVYHMYQPMVFSVVYLIFSVIYQSAGGSAIYPVLDWSKPGSAIAVSVPIVIVGVPIAHMFFFALYKIRCIVSKLCCTTDPKQKVVPLHKTESKEMFVHTTEHSRNTPLSVNTPTLMTISTTSLTPENSMIHAPKLAPTPEEP